MSRSFPLCVHSWADAAVSSCFLVVSESPNPEVPPHMSGSVINADSSCHQTQAPLSVHLFNITGALAQQAHGCRYHPPITRPVRLPCARSAGQTKNAVLFGTRSVVVTFFTKNHSKNVARTITFLFLFGPSNTKRGPLLLEQGLPSASFKMAGFGFGAFGSGSRSLAEHEALSRAPAVDDEVAQSSTVLRGVFPPEAEDGTNKVLSGLIQARRPLASGMYTFIHLAMASTMNV